MTTIIERRNGGRDGWVNVQMTVMEQDLLAALKSGEKHVACVTPSGIATSVSTALVAELWDAALPGYSILAGHYGNGDRWVAVYAAEGVEYDVDETGRGIYPDGELMKWVQYPGYPSRPLSAVRP